MNTLLSATGVGLVRGDRMLFRDVTFALDPGQCLVIEGANGSGKTSLLRVIAGLLEADAGNVFWRGESIDRQRQQYCANLVWYGHRGGTKQDLTLLENLRCEQSLRPASSARLVDVLERLGLRQLTELPVRVLSAGQQRRVALSRLLLSAAPLWLLDEPFTNLDRDGQQLITDLLQQHLAAGGTCVMATHRGVDLAMPVARLVL